MPSLPTTMADLSTTPASNFPSGSDSPSALDDAQRVHASFIRQLYDGGYFGTTWSVNATTVTWGGNPTHSGNHTFSGTTAHTGASTFASTLAVAGAFAANGGATLGDAAGDTLTINSSTASIPNDLKFSNGNVLIGFATPPTADLSISADDVVGEVGRIGFDVGGNQRAYILAYRHTATGQLTDLKFGTMGALVLHLTDAGVIKDASGYELGWKGIPASAQTSGVLTAECRGKKVKATAGVTINTGIFSDGDTFAIRNTTASAITITQGAGVTLELAGTTSNGSRTLAAKGVATISGNGAENFSVSGNVT